MTMKLPYEMSYEKVCFCEEVKIDPKSFKLFEQKQTLELTF